MDFNNSDSLFEANPIDFRIDFTKRLDEQPSSIHVSQYKIESTPYIVDTKPQSPIPNPKK